MSQKKRKQVYTERNIPIKYKAFIEGSECFYLQLAELVDEKNRFRNLLEIDKLWGGRQYETPQRLTLRGILVLPDGKFLTEQGVPFQTDQIFDCNLDFSGYFWAVGYGPRKREYYYLMLGCTPSYVPYFNRLLRFKYLGLQLKAVAELHFQVSTVREALETTTSIVPEDGIPSEEEWIQDAPLLYALLEDVFPGLPLVEDLKSHFPTVTASTESEEEASRNEEPMESEGIQVTEDKKEETQSVVNIQPDKIEMKSAEASIQNNEYKNICKMEGCRCEARENSKYCSEECGLLRAFLILKRLEYC
eukprot:jgi/Galph1/5492/GphlegSOOS_G4109.1